ncbi:MAG: DUF106 domain-containing protein [Euryarchaeota archaeon]|nr:DUF106 domain-containing protein [Euryarchaeota archaeon]
MLFMLLMMMIMFIPELRTALGNAAGIIFTPLFSFGGKYPIYTILSTGVVLTLINVWARHYFADWIQVAKVQAKMKAFNKVYREAVMKQDTAKLEKLKELQAQYMNESMSSQSKMMKSTMITLLIVIAIFTWLWTFMQYIAIYTYMAVPWNFAVDMNSSFIFPSWLWMYSAVTMPLAWVVQYIFKYFEFTKKLKEYDESGKLVEEQLEREEE